MHLRHTGQTQHRPYETQVLRWLTEGQGAARGAQRPAFSRATQFARSRGSGALFGTAAAAAVAAAAALRRPCRVVACAASAAAVAAAAALPRWRSQESAVVRRR